MIGIDTSLLVELEVLEHPEHARARQLLQREVIDGGDRLALAPQVLAEFVHVVTDHRRFTKPLSINEALDKASFWWNAAEVHHTFPSADSTRIFLKWMSDHKLGRKRLLDTQLAATLWTAGVRRIATSNPSDYAIFGVFEIVR